MRRLFRILPLLVVTLAAVAAGCGDTVSLDPVAKAADVTSRQTSEHMTVTATVTVGTQVMRMSGSGDFQNDPNLGAMTVTVNALRPATLRAVMSGTTMYMTSEVFRGELPDGKTWFALDVAKATKSMGVDLGSLSSQSPADALERLKASGSVKNLGAATIGGVATTHYSAIVDESRVAKLTKALGVSVLYAPVDVWVDAKGLVRRVHMQYVQEAGAGLPEATTQMTMSLSNYGEAVHVAVPPAAETFDATDVATSFLKK